MSMITLKNVSKKYRDLSDFAVNDVSFTLEEGEILALAGESGSGKTTLLRMIAGLEHPDAGKIILDGVSMVTGQRSVPPNARNVGMMFQDYALFPHLTIGENIAFGIKVKSKAQRNQIIDEMIALVNLKESPTKFPSQLSGGQQQRVALARALAPQPKLLLLDEPFSHLDAVLKEQIRIEVRNIIKATGISAIMVTHDTKDALSTADQIAVMQQGRLLQKATPSEIYESPAWSYVAKLFGKFNVLDVRPDASGKMATAFGFLSDSGGFASDNLSSSIFFRPSHTAVTRDPVASLSDQSMELMKGVVGEVHYNGDYWEIEVLPMNLQRNHPPIWLQCKHNDGIRSGSEICFRIERYKRWEAKS